MAIAVTKLIPSTDIALIQPLDHLQRAKRIRWRLDFQTRNPGVSVPDFDVVVFHRVCEPSSLKVLETAIEHGKAVIYDIDDNFLDMPDLPQGRYYRQPEVQSALKTFLARSHVIKVHSTLMREIAGKYNKRVLFEPDCFDLSLLQGQQKRPKRPNTVVIGYSGTHYRDRDFLPVTPALLRLAQEFPEQTFFDFMGFIPNELRRLPNVGHSPWINDYGEFVRERFRRNWDIGLAPLCDNRFNRGKSNNKYREYGASMIAGIYSNLPPYAEDVKQGVNGLLAENDERSWYQALKTLVAQPELRESIARNAHQDVISKYSVEASAEGWWRAIRESLRVAGAESPP